MHVRQIGDLKLTFIVSGRLWRNALIMQDKETGSFWDHVTGEALIGELKGKRLSGVPVVQTSWSEWVKAHPKTKVLKKEEEITSSVYENYFKDPDRTGIFRTRWQMERLPGKRLIHGISLGPHALAVPDDKLKAGKLLQRRLGEEDILVLRASDGGVRAFLAKVRDEALHFRPDSTGNQYLDEETGSVWDLEEGTCLSGRLKGERLKQLTVTAAFWFAWSSFYPNTEVVD
ncbi:MAG: DUF3179 domain-containing protein [Candidatus Zixiibacteriota bacterium]|nr:MAG: DUF3179 domain-containing protein [candidate division Zixibacteria bacterium]